MSDLHLICTCDRPATYPFRCECLELDILSSEMHTICQTEPLLINGQPRDYDRETMLAAWRRSQSPETQPKYCSGGKPTIRGAVRGAIGIAKAYSGIGVADRRTAESRYMACQKCQHNDLGRCIVCGCFVAAKVRNRGERCPVDRW